MHARCWNVYLRSAAVAKPDATAGLLSRQKDLAERIQAHVSSTEATDDLLAEYHETQQQIRVAGSALRQRLCGHKP